MTREAADSGAVIDTAVELFWKNGYDDASIDEIVRATGVNRYTIYKTFGGKRELFLASVDTYFRKVRNVLQSALSDPDLHPIGAIASFFDWVMQEMARRHTGCLICNMGIEKSRTDPAIHDRIASYVGQLRSDYVEALNKAAERGDLNLSLTPEYGADILMTLMLGLGQRARAGAGRDELLAASNSALTLLYSDPARYAAYRK